MACISFNIGAPTNYLGHNCRRSPQSFATSQLSFGKFSSLFQVGSLKFESLIGAPRRFESSRFCNTVFNALASDNGASGEHFYNSTQFTLLYNQMELLYMVYCLLVFTEFL